MTSTDRYARLKRLSWRSAVIDLVRAELDTFGAVMVTGFPANSRALVDLGTKLGSPMVKPTFRRDDRPRTHLQAFVGDVRFENSIPMDRRMPTQGADPIAVHTARSFAEQRPRWFMMAMIDPGWRDERSDCNGLTRLVWLDDVIVWLGSHLGKRGEGLIDLLQCSEIGLGLDHVAEQPVSAPLLWIGADGRPRWRYWQGIVDGVRKLASDAVVDPKVSDAITDFDKAVRAEGNILSLALNAGDLLILDNERVAHGRSGFRSLETSNDGSTAISPRRLLTLHVAGVNAMS